MRNKALLQTAGSGGQPFVLRGLVDLQPAGKGIAKLIPQIGDFIGRHERLLEKNREQATIKVNVPSGPMSVSAKL